MTVDDEGVVLTRALSLMDLNNLPRLMFHSNGDRGQPQFDINSETV